MTAPHQAPSPREDSPTLVLFDAMTTLMGIDQRTAALIGILSRSKHDHALAPADIRAYVDRINNAAQALLGCAAALEGSGREAGGK